MKAVKYSCRYIDIFIRNICEQVIEYSYIIKHDELIKKYFGDDITWDDMDESQESENLINSLKKYGGSRFGERPSVSKMAKDIEEKESDNDKISLYDIYILESDNMHNSYFKHIFEIIDEIEDVEEQQDIDYIFMIYILTDFINIYDSI